MIELRVNIETHPWLNNLVIFHLYALRSSCCCAS